ncbi:MAG: DeoR/GlpR family transcriptional regulator [Rhodospirillales bacterium]|nr:DeoR/GlpR family transcriptional regulator [Rhodospirillales bacterium]
MTIEERREQILELVSRQGYVAIDALAQHFQVTPQTIRRDINELDHQGVLQRHHGGAGLPSSVENVAYDTRQILQLDEKQRMAQLVADHIPDRASVFINIGTTTEAVAKALVDHKGLRVITNNLNVANTLSQNPDCEVIIAGGLVRSRDRGIIGEATLDLIEQFKVDFGVIGISGIDADGTLLDYDYREVRVAKAIVRNSRRVFLAADHTKIGRNAMVRLCGIDKIDSWFTDRQPSAALLKVLKKAGTTVHVAKKGRGSG